MRIVSLLPAATEMVALAGAEDELVGVTHECDHPPGVRRLPKLTSTPVDPSRMSSAEIDATVNRLSDEGSVYVLDAGLLARLRPDLVLTQGLCEVCAVSPSLVEEAVSGLHPRPAVFSMDPRSLGEVLEDALAVGEAVGRAEGVRGRVAALRERLRRVGEATSSLRPVRVVCLEWLDPLFGAGHWVPEMVKIAGGEEAVSEPGEPSRRIGWEEVVHSSPDVLVLMPCGFDARRAAREGRILTRLPGWESLPAVAQGCVWAVDANSYFSRPGPRLVEGVELLASILHPGVFPPPDPRRAVPLAHPAWSTFV
ncbi:cobalamin-binding protein [Rubrobacter calidifluminis]|uniref:cobalamin-binding protein n=1 Tax=Rubrobacter calidifluminis TaxID=1392640 RepID=UPI002361EF6E|nr:cobalamin-binding protein [Rubrobacter calidifluminis]